MKSGIKLGKKLSCTLMVESKEITENLFSELKDNECNEDFDVITRLLEQWLRVHIYTYMYACTYMFRI